jgi:hypothetical protein
VQDPGEALSDRRGRFALAADREHEELELQVLVASGRKGLHRLQRAERLLPGTSIRVCPRQLESDAAVSEAASIPARKQLFSKQNR